MAAVQNRRKRSIFIATYLAPALIVYLIFVVWPLIQAFQFSMYRWSGLSANATFTGSENFVNLWHDDVFWRSVEHNLALLAIGGIFIIAFSVLVAHMLAEPTKSSRLLRGIVLFPQMMSLTVVAILWMFIYNPQFGLLNGTLDALHLGGWAKTWLGKPQYALTAVGVAFAWYAVGFYAMLFSAGLKGIPDEVKEAAALDGATGLRRFTMVTWPMLWSIKRIVAVHLMILVLNTFTLVWLMTAGGPSRSTEVLLTYLYQEAFTDSKLGYATAVAVANFVLAMILTVVILKAIGKDPMEPRRRSGKGAPVIAAHEEAA